MRCNLSTKTFILQTSAKLSANMTYEDITTINVALKFYRADKLADLNKAKECRNNPIQAENTAHWDESIEFWQDALNRADSAIEAFSKHSVEISLNR